MCILLGEGVFTFTGMKPTSGSPSGRNHSRHLAIFNRRMLTNSQFNVPGGSILWIRRHSGYIPTDG
jgi:hypothetical protein